MFKVFSGRFEQNYEAGGTMNLESKVTYVRNDYADGDPSEMMNSMVSFFDQAPSMMGGGMKSVFRGADESGTDAF